MIYPFCVALAGLVVFSVVPPTVTAQDLPQGHVNWVDAYIAGVGEGTATPSGKKARDQVRAVRAATVLAQRALLETVQELRIDSETRVKDRMVHEDAVRTRIAGTLRGAELFRQEVRWDGDRPVATVEMRICLSGIGRCQAEKSIVHALALDQNDDAPHAPPLRLAALTSKSDTVTLKMPDIVYDTSKPVTGVVFNLRGLAFQRVLLPVVITIGEDRTPVTVYSVKSVDPAVIRTYGVVRYADSVEQARQNSYLGDNVIIVPVSGVTRDNMVMIGLDRARLIRETTSHGNDYLRSAKVIISPQ